MSLLNNFPNVIRLNILLVDLFYILIFYLAAPIRIIPGNRYEPAGSLSWIWIDNDTESQAFHPDARQNILMV